MTPQDRRKEEEIMSYFDWTGNKQGKSIYQTKIPIIFIFVLAIVLCILATIFLSGCSLIYTTESGWDYEIEVVDDDEPLMENGKRSQYDQR